MTSVTHLESPADPLYAPALGEVIRAMEQDEQEAIDLAKRPLDADERAEIAAMGAILMTPEEVKESYSYTLEMLGQMHYELQSCHSLDEQRKVISQYYRTAYHTLVLDGQPYHAFDRFDQAFDTWQAGYRAMAKETPAAQRGFVERARGDTATVLGLMAGLRYACQASYRVLREMTVAQQLQDGVPLEDCAQSVFELAERHYRKEQGMAADAVLKPGDYQPVCDAAEAVLDGLFRPFGPALEGAPPEMAYLVSEAIAYATNKDGPLRHSRLATSFGAREKEVVYGAPAMNGGYPPIQQAQVYGRMLRFANVPVPANQNGKKRERAADVLMRNVIYDTRYVKQAVPLIEQALKEHPDAGSDLGSYLNAAMQMRKLGQSPQGAAL